ncbi:hypothetical protein PtrSN002B_004524 [Pyrenophora tritici-repentis]|uniref:Uncharacterized protein n=2 Tax=Pyrenophora tritici-repentis TaxID=45151 RepID=A0A2W1HZI2_9PLEO|nr:uncharacterized protein PTRG_09323 [Pyrenophora tritici-repentis Pt-1C-BFP]KAA8617466.1 hypothetical protein PtrV1_08973 [Pyrenophora tritici-repentis]EDU42374.1 conserved hypothetical protein [Pyrenophora tritici-repentis Pt-1C-BFP]KAF7441904.1 hypothetical protein A1F99_137560 [Pyrenophora tritici-repentis]KAF7567916.1 hypothetical protein PtrM4_125290 [Pyrenophora tritici-repentis]KAG9376734.1 hypothetical protein A1F94_012334 [Pyrenophora tritici-repentis]
MQSILPTGSATHHLNLNLTPDLQTRRPYTLLIAISTPPPNSPTIISYWGPPSSPSRSHMQLQTPLTVAQVQLIASYDFGLVHIQASESICLANFLHCQLESLQTSSHDAQMVSKLVAHLHSLNAGSGSDDTVKVNILTITVLGDKSETDNLTPQDRKLLWKWAKPQSEYREKGFWNHSLTQVLENAEWNAGKGVLVFVKAVEEEEYERVVKGEMKM